MLLGLPPDRHTTGGNNTVWLAGLMVCKEHLRDAECAVVTLKERYREKQVGIPLLFSVHLENILYGAGLPLGCFENSSGNNFQSVLISC